MRTINNKAGNGKKFLRAVLVGACLGAGIMIAGAVVTSILVNLEKITMEGMRYGVVVTHLVAAFASALAAQSVVGEKLIATALINSAAYMLLLIVLNFLAFGDGYAGIFVTLGVVIAGSFAAVLVKTKYKKRSKYPRVKI